MAPVMELNNSAIHNITPPLHMVLDKALDFHSYSMPSMAQETVVLLLIVFILFVKTAVSFATKKKARNSVSFLCPPFAYLSTLHYVMASQL